MIDDNLKDEALPATGSKTKREVFELARRLKNQASIKELRGKLDWQGDLDSMRFDEASWSQGRGLTCE